MLSIFLIFITMPIYSFIFVLTIITYFCIISYHDHDHDHDADCAGLYLHAYTYYQNH